MSTEPTGYTFAAVGEILQIPESKLRYWAQTGFVGPSIKQGPRQLFSFRDLVSVKAAKELVDRGWKTIEIRRALAAARSSLPEIDRPLDRLRVAFDGEMLVVVDEGLAFEVTGQRVFDFGLAELASQASLTSAALDGAPATPLSRGRDSKADHPAAGPDRSAYDWFIEGLRLAGQPGSEAEAIAAYERALTLDAHLAAARTNLGTLLYRRGDVASARAAFEAALDLDPDQAEARFNLANLLMEEGHMELAAAELRRVLLLAPDFADAHYNLATALESLGGRTQAREHLERYLALTGASADDPWVAEARDRLSRLP